MLRNAPSALSCLVVSCGKNILSAISCHVYSLLCKDLQFLDVFLVSGKPSAITYLVSCAKRALYVIYFVCLNACSCNFGFVSHTKEALSAFTKPASFATKFQSAISFLVSCAEKILLCYSVCSAKNANYAISSPVFIAENAFFAISSLASCAKKAHSTIAFLVSCA